MTTQSNKITISFLSGSLFILMSMLCPGCKSKENPAPTSARYNKMNLVADTLGYSAVRIDANLQNAWGIAVGTTGSFWISSNHTGTTVIYDDNGAQVLAPVNIPLGTAPHGASPTGVILNTTSDFVIPGNGASVFIFSTEDGILSAWNASTGSTTITVADRSSAGAVYKGLTMATDGGANFIYATDFYNGKVDVFDKNFAYVTTKPFNDPGIPAGFSPFNIKNIDDQMYVTYAKQLPPLNHDDQAGPGNGYLDVYTPAGVFLKRLATQGPLNSPWGITKAPAAFGQGANAILIGNFGDGHINVFDSNGGYHGGLLDNNITLTIEGLWDITFNAISPADPNQMYFTAGPSHENHGLFGYLKKI